MKIIESIKKHAKDDIIAAIYEGEKLSYKDLDAYSEAIDLYLKYVHGDEKNELTNIKNSTLIKKELSKYSPQYIIPRNKAVIDEFPINTNGKIDGKKLMGDL